MSTAPDFMPVLSSGAHTSPKEGACVMEYVSLLAGESWSDSPSCTHSVLAQVAQRVNDRLPDEDRHLLVPLIGRLMGTAPTGTDHDRKVLAVRFGVWGARRVLRRVPAGERREKAEAAIVAAEGWCDGAVTREQCRSAAYAYAYAYATATAVATAAATAAYAAATAATTAATAAYAATAYAATADAADAAAYAATADAAAADAADVQPQLSRSERSVQFLSDLIDEHDRLTGRTATPVISSDALRRVAAHVG